jgi:dihydroorotase
MKILIHGGTIVNEGKTFRGNIIIDGDRINEISETTDKPRGDFDKAIDATGCFVLPGVIDEHVHFREPGLEHKADIESESRAAAYGGVTSYLEMPNTKPATTTIEALDQKFLIARQNSHVNYSFFFGATNDNAPLFHQLDVHRIPGIKLFMGASTGNMLVDKASALRTIFAEATMPIMTHCEDTNLINQNMQRAKALYGDDPTVIYHAEIRSAEACYQSTRLAVELAREYGSRLHVAHLTTAHELEFFGSDPRITAEAVVSHLLFTDSDYTTLGTKIKCNPAVKTLADRTALRRAVSDGTITCIATDHAPHAVSDKQGGCAHAASGMPMVQFSLISMLQLVSEGCFSIERLVQAMCHNPATLFEISRRGFLRKDYKADIAIVRQVSPWTLTPDIVQSKCGWSPLEGKRFTWQVTHTICNGNIILENGKFDAAYRGEALSFRL